MSTVVGKTSIKIDDLINDTVVTGHIDSTSGHLILGTRGGASLDAGAVIKPFGSTWSSVTAYTNGDVVGYAGALWRATGSSTNKCPALFTSLWNRLTGESLYDWVERDGYFDSDASLTESWQMFWITGTVTSSLDSVAGEFETGIQSLKLNMLASSFQRFYQREENIVYGGEVIQVSVRAKLLAAASGVTINAEMLQNAASGKPEPFETGITYTASAEGAATLTTSWATYTFTMTAANAKPRAIVDVLVNTGANAAVVLVDRVKIVKGTGPAISKVDTDKLYLPKYQEYDSGWIYLSSTAWGVLPSEIALQNGAGIYGGTFGMPRIRRIGDIVYMEGLVSSPPAGGGVIFNLPVGFRPDGDIIPVGVGSGATENSGIRILATGDVLTATSVTGFTSLNCQFPAAGGAYTWHIIGAAGEPAFGSGWTNYGGGWQTGRFTKIGDFVYLSGLITRSTTATTTAFALPAGYTNTNGTSHTPVAATGTLGGTDFGVNISNIVTARGTGTGGFLSLAGIRFFAGVNDNKWKKFRAGSDGWYGIAGAYGSPWPVPAVRRDGKIVFLEGLANFASSGQAMKLPWGYAPGGLNLFPILNSTNRRLDIHGPYEEGAGTAGAVSNYATGVNGFTVSWVVAEEFENDIRWTS